MKHYFLGLLFIPLVAWAQHDTAFHSHLSEDSLQNHCKVVYLPDDAFPNTMRRSIRPLGEPSTFPSENSAPQIFDNGYEYVYRLAFCLSPYYINDVFFGNMDRAREWVKEAGEYLNMVYSRDFGIRFDIIEDDRLFLSQYPEDYPEHEFKQHNGTKIINDIIGAQAYDCGILIRPRSNGISGQASLGGAYTSIHKGSAMATFNLTTIAHELGHMFGAKHTHVKEDGLCIEPGAGQSIMSYGEPRTSFSLASVISVRRHLKNQHYYPNNKRDSSEIVGGIPDENSNIPYVIPTTRTQPKLNRKQIRKNYTVTKDTRFQFYIPVEDAKSSYTYGAQSYDDAIWGFQTNELQPVYSLSKVPNTMFQPYYDEGKNELGRTDAVLVPHSDAYRTGRYTYLLAVADGARYDLEEINLNIVDGKPFQLKTKIDVEQFFGQSLKLEWDPCTDLYGTDSRVRILLSDDFGQTYKYVIDDQVPNSGTWEGFWPFIEIGRNSYRNFSQPIRGGVIKIEVIGEAAYSVSKELPGMANPTMLYSGGFTLNDSRSKVLFKNGPTPYLYLKATDPIPEMTELEAYPKNSPGKITLVQGKETRKGNVIRRQWKTELNGYSYAYSQLIVIEEQSLAERAEVSNKADEVKLMADDLYHHKGEMGYPLPSLPVMQKLDTVYTDVFDTEGKVKTDATVEKVAELRSVLEAISTIKDNEIVKPGNRHYYTLRNYQDMYGRYSYYYLGSKKNPEDNNGFTTDASQAIVWRCTEEDGNYSLHDAQGKCINLDPFIIPGYNETMTLEKGYTWGAFTLVNNIRACAQLSQGAKYFSRNEYYIYDPVGYRTNRNGTVSTDFQFLPVDFVEARKTAEEYPWNILENKQQLTLADTYSDLYVDNPVTVDQLLYIRNFDDTEWQTLYLPFDTECDDWTQYCEIACVNQVQLIDTNSDGIANEAIAEYVTLQNGKLLANQPYLIKAKATGSYTFTLNDVTIKSTEENEIKLNTPDFTITMTGNYGMVSAESLMNNNGYILQRGMFCKADTKTEKLSSMRWYLNVASTTGNSSVLPETITLVEKGEVPIGVMSITTNEGYGTIYTENSYIMPDGVTGYAITQADTNRKELILAQIFGSGETVPAHTPLLVKGEKRIYMLYAPKTEIPANEELIQSNLLMGTETSEMTVAPNGQAIESYRFYKLNYTDVNNSGIKRLGFYWGAPEGAPFTNEANKAYLALKKDLAEKISGFALPEDGEASIFPVYAPTEHIVIYTITGIRLNPKAISDLPPGIYIINGKKKIIK